MSIAQKASPNKPSKPYPDFPLYPHATGRWAKKIRGRLHYFGPWDDPEGALQRYLDQRDDLHAGRKPRMKGEGLAVRELLNRFLTSKKRLVDAGELVPLTFQGYHEVCQRLAKSIQVSRLVSDLAADDFEKLRADLAETRGPTSLANDITRIRSIFKYAYDSGLMDRPVRFGPNFKKPSRRVLRKVKHDKGPLMFEAHELRAMVDAATIQLRAMILLGVNCGFGNTDCGTLPFEALDLDRGWLDYPRTKNENPRRCPLWPETVEAIRHAIDARPQPKCESDSNLVFITSKGGSWIRTNDRPISKEIRKLLKGLGLYRPGLSFYSLRRTFETIAGESLDQAAVDFVMGHIADANDMAARYRQRIGDERLIAATEHVHKWLFPNPEG